MTGRPVRVAVIDSGVAIPHPHIGAVAGGISIDESGESADFSDRIGHGTAVMAAIMEKAPPVEGMVEYLAVRVFQASLRTRIEFLLRGIEWSLGQRVDLINLSLGTAKPDYAERFTALIGRGARLIAPASSIPGSLPGVIRVFEAHDCPRDEYRRLSEFVFAASPFPRPVPGVPPERNLNGISFAVANITGFLARDYETIFSSKPASR
jgi:hypothetical protein